MSARTPRDSTLVLAIPAGVKLEQLDREHNPAFADHGEYIFPDGELPGAIAEHVLVYANGASGTGASYVGLLRSVELDLEERRLRFRRYEAFASPIRTPESHGASAERQATGGPRCHVLTPSQLGSILEAAGKIPQPEAHARTFVQRLASSLPSNPAVAERARAALHESAPLQHRFHPNLKRELAAYLAAEGLDEGRYRLDARGLLQDGTERARYSMLGTYAQPDAAVVEPFRAAVDYVLQRDPTSGSEARAALLASFAHVASGQYDAALTIFIGCGEPSHGCRGYLSLTHGGTRTFLGTLRRAGVELALIDPSPVPAGHARG